MTHSGSPGSTNAAITDASAFATVAGEHGRTVKGGDVALTPGASSMVKRSRMPIPAFGVRSEVNGAVPSGLI